MRILKKIFQKNSDLFYRNKAAVLQQMRDENAKRMKAISLVSIILVSLLMIPLLWLMRIEPSKEIAGLRRISVYMNTVFIALSFLNYFLIGMLKNKKKWGKYLDAVVTVFFVLYGIWGIVFLNLFQQTGSFLYYAVILLVLSLLLTFSMKNAIIQYLLVQIIYVFSVSLCYTDSMLLQGTIMAGVFFTLMSLFISMIHFHSKANGIIQQLIIEKQNAELIRENEIRKKFFNIVAHDLKNPIIGIRMAAEDLLEQVQPVAAGSRSLQTTELIARTAGRTAELLEKLISWGRAQSDTLRIKPVPVDAAALVHRIAAGIPAIVRKNLSLQILSRGSGLVQADLDILETVLRNLLVNAAKFSHQGGVVKVLVADTGKGGFFAVKDEGIGIPEQHLERLFTAGSQYVQSGTDGESGSGIGLLICKELVERHGGRIRARSLPGRNTTFLFYLEK